MPDARIQPEDENRDVTATPQGAGNLSRSLSFLPDPLGTVENYPRDSFIGTVSPKFADQVANPHGDTYTDFLSVTPSVSQANPLGPRRVPYTTDELANIWYYSHLRALPRDAGYIILLTRSRFTSGADGAWPR